jgi:hypothetical protein
MAAGDVVMTHHPQQERRAAPRKRCLLSGRALYSDLKRSRDLTVRNISEDGALIECGHVEELPDQFTLSLPVRGVTHEARVRWRARDQAGLSLGDASIA